MQTSICVTLIVISYFCTIQSTLSQQWDFRQSGTKAFSLSGASSTLKNEFSILNNPSTLPYVSGIRIGLGVNQIYLAEGLNTSSLGISYSINKIGLGLGIERFGDLILNKSRIRAGVAHKVGNSSIGMAFTLHQDYVEDYGYSKFLGFEFSSFTQLTSKISVSLIISNPIIYHMRWREASSKFIAITSGLSYVFSDSFILYLDFQKTSFNEFNSRIGATYNYQEKLFLYVGILTKPIQQSLGIGYKKGKFEFQMGASIHHTLGISCSGTILISFLKKHET